MSELVIRANEVELATQSFGNPAQPPVLLIMGGIASMLWWPQEFCRRLAARGRFVIRYENNELMGFSLIRPLVLKEER